jgi:hypothetical protein
VPILLTKEEVTMPLTWENTYSETMPRRTRADALRGSRGPSANGGRASGCVPPMGGRPEDFPADLRFLRSEAAFADILGGAVGPGATSTGRSARIASPWGGGHMAEETPAPIYANVVQITTGPFDLVLDFGFKSPEQARRGSADYELVARIAMSLAHAKSMLPLLAKVIAEYEEKVGPITAPGFEGFSKD